MGWTVGFPSLKLNNMGTKSKHCGSFSAVAAEALEERRGHDMDIDHEKSFENIYSGFRSAAELEEYSQKHVSELSAKQVANGGRKIRNDAVVMCATIVKPPAAMMNQISREDQVRFFNNAAQKFADIVGCDNIKSTVIHFDEQGSHMHLFWEPMTKDGRLCAKEQHNLQFLSRINREMPEHLRSCGWDINDCKAYDQAQEALKSALERSEARANHGRSGVSYKADAEREKLKLLDEIDHLKEIAEQQQKVIQKQQENIETLKNAKGPLGWTGPLKRENDDLKLTIAVRERQIGVLESEKNTLESENSKLKNEMERQKENRPPLDDLLENIDAEKVKLENTRYHQFFEFLEEHFPPLYNRVMKAYEMFEKIFYHNRDMEHNGDIER